MNIFIGSLPYSVKESSLKEFFEEYGEVSSVKIITDKMTGRSKGFAFVEMPDETAGKRAIEELNGATIDNREIVVNEAHERTEGERHSSNGNGNSSYGNRRKSGGGGYGNNRSY